jgi:hypothetical protein
MILWEFVETVPARSRRIASAVAAILLAAGIPACSARKPAAREAGATPSSSAPAPATPPPAVPAAETEARPEISFEATVRPILAAKCAPCHNPGGKMYERLPFDQPSVVASHAAGVRRRLKGDDLQTLERWLSSRPAPPADDGQTTASYK